MGLKAIFQTLGDMLFPPRCLFCEEPIYPGWEICDSCEKAVAVSSVIRRMKLGPTGDTVGCLTLYPYEGLVKESLLRFKFHGKREYAAYYGRILAEELQKSVPLDHPLLVTAVPLSIRRLRERGYNQSEQIARRTAECLKLPYEEVLLKIKENRVQHELSGEERQKNVRGVYRVHEGIVLVGKTVLLVDDIVTTGATLCECTRMLYKAGASQVFCAAIADVHWSESQNSG